MPYLNPSDRAYADEYQDPLNAGMLNYLVTRLVQKYLSNYGGLSYESLNAAIGALECAKLELYRRMVAPYEDEKIALNSDVYE